MMFRVILASLLLIASTSAQSHLLPKQNATMKIVDNTANFVVSVPASALAGVDDNGDGEFSAQEIELHDELIKKQFISRFSVSNDGKSGLDFMTMVMQPQTDGGHHHSDYVVFLHRVKFDKKPTHPLVKTDLFGTREDEGQLSFRATLDDTREVAVLTPADNEHEFFRSLDSSESYVQKQDTPPAGFNKWFLLLAIIPIAGIIFYIRQK